MEKVSDIFIIGGGINGCGIAADAAGRGLSVILVEQNDLGSGTSSASSKLIHGGLRYLEYYEFSLVRKALKEREVLLKNAPHIIKPMRFLLPHHNELRPKWLIRLGLFIYDHLGGRELLPPTSTQKLTDNILKDDFKVAFEYSDCWVDDARLVILNAMQARGKGALILPRHKCVSAIHEKDYWLIKIENSLSGEIISYKSKTLINAAGPWVDGVISTALHMPNKKLMRLVKGSHIIVEKLYDHDKAYLFQGADGRIIFSIPYLDKFTVIGTTDQEYTGDFNDVSISPEEIDYLCEKASIYFSEAITADTVLHSYAGVRPLYNDGASAAQEATRDFVLMLDKNQALLNVVGGKITTYRVLAEKVLSKLKRYFPEMEGSWTADAPLPGGDINIEKMEENFETFCSEYPFLPHELLTRLWNSYGTSARDILKGAHSLNDLGLHFGAGLYQVEVQYLCDNEWAMTADDILWRRTKLGYFISKQEKTNLSNWILS